MIQRVYEQAQKALEEIWVATDDERIVDAVKGFGGNVVMTSTNHRSGTDRCAEAALKITELTGKTYDVVVNIQGDEPFMQPREIGLIRECFTDSANTEIATLIQPILKNEDIFKPVMVKVVLDKDSNAIFFSRAPIPHIFNIDESKWLESYPFYGHVGLYAYRFSVLQECTCCSESFIRASHPIVATIVLDKISLDYQETLMAASGYQAEEAYKTVMAKHSGEYIVMVEGSIPTENEAYCCIGGRSVGFGNGLGFDGQG